MNLRGLYSGYSPGCASAPFYVPKLRKGHLAIQLSVRRDDEHMLAHLGREWRMSNTLNEGFRVFSYSIASRRQCDLDISLSGGPTFSCHGYGVRRGTETGEMSAPNFISFPQVMLIFHPMMSRSSYQHAGTLYPVLGFQVTQRLNRNQNLYDVLKLAPRRVSSSTNVAKGSRGGCSRGAGLGIKVWFRSF